MAIPLFRLAEPVFVGGEGECLARDLFVGLGHANRDKTQTLVRLLSWQRRCAIATDRAWAGCAASRAICAATAPAVCVEWPSLWLAGLRFWPTHRVRLHARTASPEPIRAPAATADPTISSHAASLAPWVSPPDKTLAGKGRASPPTGPRSESPGPSPTPAAPGRKSSRCDPENRAASCDRSCCRS